jgi:hypothetical protein
VSLGLFDQGRRKGQVEIASVTVLGALWAHPDGKWPLVQGFVGLVLAVLIFAGLAVPEGWTWWPWVPGLFALIKTFLVSVLEVRRSLP